MSPAPEPSSRPRKTYTEEELRSYKEKCIRYVANITVGSKDIHGEEVVNIYSSTEDYIIYETKDDNPSLDVKVCIYPEDIHDTSIESRYDKIQPKYIKAKALLHKVENPVSIRSRIAGLMSYALAADAYTTLAETGFDELIQEIHDEFNQRIYNKIAFLFTNILLSSIFAALTLWRFRSISTVKTYQSYHLDIYTLLMCVATCAMMGGTFSLSIKLRNLTTTRSVQPLTYFFYGLERLFISTVAGIILFWAIFAKLIFDALIKDIYSLQGLSALFLLATIAGFSETLVPDLLVSMDKGSKKQQEEGNKS